MGGQVSLCFRWDWVLGSLPLDHSRTTLLNLSNNNTLIHPRPTRLRSRRRMVRGPRSFRVRGVPDPAVLSQGIIRVQPQPLDQKIPPQDPVVVYQSYQSNQPSTPNNVAAGPSVPTSGIPCMPQTRVYHYVNPSNGNHVTSLLPPDHPEMVCLQQGSHVEETKFGFFGESFWFYLSAFSCLFLGPVLIWVCWTGVLAAIVWFPLGIGLCLLDRTVTCKRCGAVIKSRPSIQLGGSNRRNGGRN